MLAIHRTVRRAAFAAVAAVLAGSFTAQSAHAAQIYTAGGFEGFTNNPISGQSGGTPAMTWSDGLNGAGSTETVVGSGGIGNTKALQITKTSNSDLVTSPTFSNSILANTVTVSVGVDITAAGAGNGTSSFGPAFGINIVGNAGASNLGSFGIDSSTNTLVLDNGDNSFNATPNNVDFNTVLLPGFHTLTLTATNPFGSSVVLNAFVDGGVTPVATFTSLNQASTFTFGNLFGESDFNTAESNNFGGTALFDNFTVSADANVPEPASLSLIGLAFIGLCARRTKRVASAL